MKSNQRLIARARDSRGSSEVLSAQIMKALQTAYPEVQTARWRDAVLDAFLLSSRRSGLPRDFAEMVCDMRYQPDGFVVNKAERFLHFFEIEVYNPMSSAKCEAYARFALDLHYYWIDFGVLVVNRHGHVNHVDLFPHYLRSTNPAPTAPSA